MCPEHLLWVGEGLSSGDMEGTKGRILERPMFGERGGAQVTGQEARNRKHRPGQSQGLEGKTEEQSELGGHSV